MSLALEQIKVATLGGTLAREMAQIEEERTSWRKALIETNLIDKQVWEFAENSANAQMAKERKAWLFLAMSIAKQYQDLFGPNSAIGSAYMGAQKSERLQMEQMRKMFNPMADIRKSVLGDTTIQQFIKELMDGSSMRSQMTAITDQAFGIGSVAKMLAQQAEDSRAQTKKLFENLGVGSSIQSYLKDFEHMMMFEAARIIRHARRWVLGISGADSGFAVFERAHAKFKAA